MKTLITLQDLKDNRQLIIDYVTDNNENTGNFVDLKRLMNFMLESVEIGLAEIKDDETFSDYISATYDSLRERSRKVPKYAETIGRLEEAGHINIQSLNERYGYKY